MNSKKYQKRKKNWTNFKQKSGFSFYVSNIFWFNNIFLMTVDKNMLKKTQVCYSTARPVHPCVLRCVDWPVTNRV